MLASASSWWGRRGDLSAELELVVDRNYILVAARHRRLDLVFSLFFHDLEIRFLLGLLCGGGLGDGAAALACAGLDEPRQRGGRQPGLDADQVCVGELAGSEKIADLLKGIRPAHASAAHDAE